MVERTTNRQVIITMIIADDQVIKASQTVMLAKANLVEDIIVENVPLAQNVSTNIDAPMHHVGNLAILSLTGENLRWTERG